MFQRISSVLNRVMPATDRRFAPTITAFSLPWISKPSLHARQFDSHQGNYGLPDFPLRGPSRRSDVMLSRLIALIFLAAIALIPVAIVAFWHRMGAIWVAGYAVGIITVPLVGIGALRAMSAMFEEPKAVIALVIFGGSVIVVSLAAAAYALL